MGVFWPIFTPGRLIRESFWLAESTFYQLITFKVVCTTLIATIIHMSVLYSKIKFFPFWGHFRGLGLMAPLISTCINYLSKLLNTDNFSMIFKKQLSERTFGSQNILIWNSASANFFSNLTWFGSWPSVYSRSPCMNKDTKIWFPNNYIKIVGH